MTKEFDIQAPREQYYTRKYNDMKRFISYFYQIDLIKQLNAREVLEVGIGNKTVSNYLKQQGFRVTTCDFDASLDPDYVADVRNLPFEDNFFDAVLAYEILEHIPWDDVPNALKELHRVTKNHLIVSIPYASTCIEITLWLPLFQLFHGVPLICRIKAFKKPYIDLFLRIPWFWKKKIFDGEHYWEMGNKDYSKRTIRKMLGEKFSIVREVRPLLDAYHYFFVLKK